LAYLETTFWANDGSGPMAHYFNLSEPVGKSCPNRPDDVALIQVLLQSLCNLPESPVQGGTMLVDGIWTPQLSRAVRIFQKLAARGLARRGAGERIAVDELVVPARAIYVDDTLLMFTIIALNKAYAHYYWHDYVQKWPMQRALTVCKAFSADAVERSGNPIPSC
jgi:hypothetical protein